MKSLFTNSIFNFVSQLIIFACAFLLSVFLARSLGPSQMGQYSYFIWIITTGTLVLTLGIPRTLTRFISRSTPKNLEASQIFTRTLILQAKILAIFLIIALIFIHFFGGEERVLYLIIALTMAVSVLNGIFASGLVGLQNFASLLKINLLVSPLLLIFSLIILLFFRSLENLLFVNLVISLISLLISIIFAKGLINFSSKKLNLKLKEEIKKYALSISAIVFLDLILMEKSEVFFLNKFSTLEQVAFYSIGFGLVGKVMTLIPGAISGVIMPRVAELDGKKNEKLIKETFFNSARYLIFVSIPIMFAGIVLINLAVSIFYGSEYSTVVPVVQILLVSGALSAVSSSAAALLFGTGKQNFILKLAVAAAGINILLDLILIPQYGAIGASFANAIAQTFGFLIGMFYPIKIKKMPFPWKDTFKILISAFLASMIIYFLSRVLNFSEIIMLITLTILYTLIFLRLLFLLKFFNKKDKDLFERFKNKLKIL